MGEHENIPLAAVLPPAQVCCGEVVIRDCQAGQAERFDLQTPGEARRLASRVNSLAVSLLRMQASSLHAKLAAAGDN